MKIPLLGMSLDELSKVVSEAGLPKFTAKQVADWIYKKKVTEIDGMTNLSKSARALLSEKYEVGVVMPVEKHVSADGTKKYIFPYDGKRFTEAVMIPDGDRRTLCVSSQAGCKMGCRFCMTGRQGFGGNMSVSRILSQYYGVDEKDGLTNTVFMGMGEPLDNYENVRKAIEVLVSDWGFAWSPKRITLSSIGVLPALKRFLDETKVHLAISLHDPFAGERLSLMPVQNKYPIGEVVALIRKYDFTGQRRVSFEYTMFSGVNDSLRHADAIVSMLRGIECRVNLIRFHQIPDSPLSPSPDKVMEMFRNRLSASGLTATIRASRGEDILAACGLLAGKAAQKENGLV